MTRFENHLLKCYYLCNKLHYSPNSNNIYKKYLKKIIYKYYSFFLKFLYGSFIPYKAQLGKNIKFKHSFHGIFISQHAQIGNNCILLHHITIGSNTKKGITSAPIIGNNVFIGVNALIIGTSIIRDNCKIGAGVVITNKEIKINSTIYTDSLTIIS